MEQLSAFRLDALPFLASLWAVASALALIALAVPVRHRPSRVRYVLAVVLAGIAGAAFMFGLLVLLLDVIDIFGGATMPWAARWSLSAGIGLAVSGGVVLFARRRWRPGGWRRVLGGLLVVASLLAGAAGLNAAYGEIRTVGQLFPQPVADPSAGGVFPAKLPSATTPITERDWTPPADMPTVGSVLQVPIPATTSGFDARPGYVYLPPAALVPNPPILPVVVMLSGQPGAPNDVLTSGEFQQRLDAYAAEHRGLAPIVVLPDQLGAPDRNPMCVDGPLGASRTYLEVDVPAFIEQHLNVATDRRSWTFGGFSQGATCTVQIGVDQPNRYANNVAVAPELIPTIGGDESQTLGPGFGGNQVAYDAAKPLNILKAHAPYRDTLLILGVGDQDAVFTMWSKQIEQVATEAGMNVTRITSPGTSHDFHTVSYTLLHALPILMQRAGVTA